MNDTALMATNPPEAPQIPEGDGAALFPKT